MRALILVSTFFLCSCLKQTPVLTDSKRVFLEVNTVPHPFSLAGNYPYVLWVNGERFNVPTRHLHAIINEIGMENIPYPENNDIHKGWIYPYYVKQEGDPNEWRKSK